MGVAKSQICLVTRVPRIRNNNRKSRIKTQRRLPCSLPQPSQASSRERESKKDELTVPIDFAPAANDTRWCRAPTCHWPVMLFLGRGRPTSRVAPRLPQHGTSQWPTVPAIPPCWVGTVARSGQKSRRTRYNSYVKSVMVQPNLDGFWPF